MNKPRPKLAKLFTIASGITLSGVTIWFMAALLAVMEGFDIFVPFDLVAQFFPDSQIITLLVAPFSVTFLLPVYFVFRYFSIRLLYSSSKEMDRDISREHRKQLVYCGKVESVSVNEEPGLINKGIFTLITDIGIYRCNGTFNAIQVGARVQQDGSKLIIRTPKRPKIVVDLALLN